MSATFVTSGTPGAAAATEQMRAVHTHPQRCLCGAEAVTTSHSHFSTDRPACAACSRVLRVLSFIHHNVTVSAL
jgi:hypothetical protein